MSAFLTGQLAAKYVFGMQENVIACVKHFIGNEQETNRGGPISPSNKTVVSSDISDRALREVYMWPFAESIRAGVGCIMCSYQKVNGTFACENEELLGTAKEKLEFPGFIVSDWWVKADPLKSLSAGLDLWMPDDGYVF